MRNENGERPDLAKSISGEPANAAKTSGWTTLCPKLEDCKQSQDLCLVLHLQVSLLKKSLP